MKLLDESEVDSGLERKEGTNECESHSPLANEAGKDLVRDSTEKIPSGIAHNSADLFSPFTDWRSELIPRLAA